MTDKIVASQVLLILMSLDMIPNLELKEKMYVHLKNKLDQIAKELLILMDKSEVPNRN